MWRGMASERPKAFMRGCQMRWPALLPLVFMAERPPMCGALASFQSSALNSRLVTACRDRVDLATFPFLKREALVFLLVTK